MMNFPADDQAAKDVRHHIQAVELPAYSTGQECDIPGPDLIGAGGHPGGGLWHGARRLRTTATVQLPLRFKLSVKAGFRCDINALVSQLWHDLRGWQALMLGAVAYR